MSVSASRALAYELDRTPPDAAQLGQAFETLCVRLRARLQAMFGGAAVEALFARSLHLARGEFPWLKNVSPADAVRYPSSGAAPSVDVAVMREIPGSVMAEAFLRSQPLTGTDCQLDD